MIRVRVGKLGKRGAEAVVEPEAQTLANRRRPRGMAVVCMVFYHFMWDMMFFGLYPHDVTSGGWRLFARSVTITFLVLVGVSMVLTAQRKRPAERNRQWLERGAKVFGWGLLISVVARIFLGEAFVLYGILHLIGTAFLLAPLLWRIRRWTPLLGVSSRWAWSWRTARPRWLIFFHTRFRWACGPSFIPPSTTFPSFLGWASLC